MCTDKQLSNKVKAVGIEERKILVNNNSWKSQYSNFNNG